MKIIDIALKDLLRSMRSAFTIGMSVIVPLLITGLIYFAFGGMASGNSTGFPAVKVGVVNADTLPSGSPLAEPLGNNIRAMFFDDSAKTWISASDYPDEASVRAAVDQQEIGVGVIIPAVFTTDFLAGKQDTPITLVQDPTLGTTPLIVRNMLVSLLDGASGGGIALQTVIERQQEQNIAADPAQTLPLIEQYQNWYVDFQRIQFHDPQRAVLVSSATQTENQQTNSVGNMLGIIMTGQLIFFSFYTGANAMMTILQEQEEGTLARLFTTPTKRTLILGGKFLAVLLNVILQGLVLLVAGRFAFGIHWGTPASITLALSAQAIAATGLGVLLIAFVKDTRQGGFVLGGALSALGMLSGLFTVAVPGMPAIFDLIANFTPQGWVLKAWRAALSGAPTGELVLPFFVCLLLGVFMFAAGAVLFRRRFA